ncbi:MAG: PulJ/GspJ family protein [Phycisphaeraceae bacterium]
MNSRSIHPRTLSRRRGLTLVEMVLALAITGLVGAAIAAMLSAVAYGSDSSRDMRNAAVQSKALSARLGAAVRGSRLVLDQGEDFLVLWTTDADENGAPSLQEIQRLEHNGDDDALVSYRADDSAPDAPYELDDDFGALTRMLKGSDYFPASVWGRDVTAWALTLDDNDPQAAALVSFRLTLAIGELEHTAIGAAALRN